MAGADEVQSASVKYSPAVGSHRHDQQLSPDTLGVGGDKGIASQSPQEF
jgi:hypothetical protein